MHGVTYAALNTSGTRPESS